jgi:hypothetical protein
MIALGGWTGCFTCSATFSDKNKRIEFAKSTKAFIDHFQIRRNRFGLGISCNKRTARTFIPGSG